MTGTDLLSLTQAAELQGYKYKPAAASQEI